MHDKNVISCYIMYGNHRLKQGQCLGKILCLDHCTCTSYVSDSCCYIHQRLIQGHHSKEDKKGRSYKDEIKNLRCVRKARENYLKKRRRKTFVQCPQ